MIAASRTHDGSYRLTRVYSTHRQAGLVLEVLRRELRAPREALHVPRKSGERPYLELTGSPRAAVLSRSDVRTFETTEEVLAAITEAG